MLLLSMVIGTVFHEQTTKFLSDNNNFCKDQSGLRSSHSTDVFLSFLNDDISKGFDNEMYTGPFLTDLQKALDKMNRKILLNELFPITFLKEWLL